MPKFHVLKFFRKNASFLLHIDDIFRLFLWKPSANVDICLLAQQFIATNFCKNIHYIFKIFAKCGNGFSWKTKQINKNRIDEALFLAPILFSWRPNTPENIGMLTAPHWTVELTPLREYKDRETIQYGQKKQ